jgi:hypothetical protein
VALDPLARNPDEGAELVFVPKRFHDKTAFGLVGGVRLNELRCSNYIVFGQAGA